MLQSTHLSSCLWTLRLSSVTQGLNSCRLACARAWDVTAYRIHMFKSYIKLQSLVLYLRFFNVHPMSGHCGKRMTELFSLPRRHNITLISSLSPQHWSICKCISWIKTQTQIKAAYQTSIEAICIIHAISQQPFTISFLNMVTSYQFQF